MKFSTLATVAVAAVGVSAAQPHAHGHHHAHHERSADPAMDVEMVVAFEYEGQSISAADVQQGLANGTLQWSPNGDVVPQAPAAPADVKVNAQAYSSAPASSSAAPPTSSPPPPPPSTTSVAPSSSAPAPSTSSVPAPAPSSYAAPAPSASSSLPSSSGVDSVFPNGQLDCSTFPSAYGAMALDYLNLGGWSGIQCPLSVIGGFSDITTKTSGGCTEGSYCSYACPAGYQKSQWPSTQGATGQSVGGLLCQNGKLHLTNPDMSTSLCMPGSQAVSVMVKNNMGQNAAVCRTDYPGTEGETIPLDSTPGSTQNLTCPDAANYYNWQGQQTSAQYYVNPKGVSVQDACQWGTPGTPTGNYAPLNLGVGYRGGSAWLSIFQNLPTTSQLLDFTVELVGDNGGYDNLNGRCKYQNGQYCSGDDYSQCSPKGCTVSVSRGTATYVFSS